MERIDWTAEMAQRCINAIALLIATTGCGYRVARESVRKESVAGAAVWERVDAHFKALPASSWPAGAFADLEAA